MSQAQTLSVPDAGTSGVRLSAPARALLILGALLVASVLVWQALTAGGSPDPLARGTSSTAATMDIGVLVFREGLECILVLAAITASMVGASRWYRRPVAIGAAVAFVASILTWQVAVGILDNLTESIPALHVQAFTGLLAIVVLLVVMNWFFHKLYWTGWISHHNQRRKELVKLAQQGGSSRRQLLLGLGMLGFTSLYREGFEVVLFLQSYRMKLGGPPVLRGVLIGLFLAAIVAVFTFVAQRRLPYRQMLVSTGVLLGGVLLVMVGEQAQEMQLAHWLTTTEIPTLARVFRPWMGMWFGLFPTVESLAAQGIAALLVLGSYGLVRFRFMTELRRAVSSGGARKSQPSA
jgi:high-affinity iron transporter